METLDGLELANARLDGPADLAAFVAKMPRFGGISDEQVSLRVFEFAELRSVVRDLFEAAAEGRPLPADAVRRLNETSLRVPRAPVLDPAGRGLIERDLGGSRTAAILAAVARSTIALLGGEDRDRIQRCPSCGDYFLATRSDRKWCSAACGNRTRVARHYARARARDSGAT